MDDDNSSVVTENVEEELSPLETAIAKVIEDGVKSDSIVRGLREVVKAIEQKAAQIVFLASNCEEKGYVELITALCKSKQVNLVSVSDSKQLGKWAGLCRYDKDEEVRDIVGASSVALTQYEQSTESEHYEVFNEHLKKIASEA